jgi:hypothetical protein
MALYFSRVLSLVSCFCLGLRLGTVSLSLSSSLSLCLYMCIFIPRSKTNWLGLGLRLGLGGLGLGSRVGAVACFVSAFLYAASVPIHKCPVSVLRCSERLAPALWCVPVSALYLHTRSRARHVTCRRVVHRLLLLLIR